MANKEQILDYIKDLAVRNLITKDELTFAYDKGRKTHCSWITIDDVITNILIYIGGLSIFFGVEFYFYQKIFSLSNLVFLLSTFGIGIIFYAIGIILDTKKDLENISSFFYLISSILIITGSTQFFFHNGLKIAYGTTIISAFLVLLYLVPFLILRKSIFLFFTIIFTTIVLGNLFGLAILSFKLDYSIISYFCAIIGIIYIYLARLCLGTDVYKLSAWLDGFGSSFFLSSVLYLCCLKYGQDLMIELIFIPLFLTMITSGIYLGSKSIVVMSGLYFVNYAVKLAEQYLVNDYGVAIIPIVFGMAVIFNLGVYNSLKSKFFYNH